MSSINRSGPQLNLEALKLTVGFGEGLPEKKETTRILLRKPPKQTYLRMHPDSTWQLSTYVIDLKEEGETYLVAPPLWEELSNELTPKILISCITRQDTFFFWPIRLPDKDGWSNPWSRSAIDCVKIGEQQWIRIESNMEAQCYEPLIAKNQDNLPDPNWPVLGFEALLKLAVKDHYIDSIDHPLVKKLRGIV